MLRVYSVRIITVDGLPGNQVTVSADIKKQAKLRSKLQLQFKVGNRHTVVNLIGCHGTTAGTSICISPQVRNSLLLPTPLTLNLLAAEETNIWRLGPLIGIFACRGESSTRPFGEQTSFFRRLKAAAKDLDSFCYAFGPEDIDWENKVIRGAIPPHPQSEGEWKNLNLPFPDAIYDRGLFPHGVKRKIATETRKILRNYPEVKFFNPAFFGKWKTHKLLSKHEVLIKYLPETKIFTSSADVTELLNKHGTVFLKPSGGSSGRGILRISADTNGYTVNHRVSRQVKTIRGMDTVRLERFLLHSIGQTRYIAQQGLRLAKLQGSLFDIRVLLQKNCQGIWQRTGMAARVAGAGNYISNIHAGGHAAKISSILPHVFDDHEKVQKIRNEINRLTSLIAMWVSSEGNPLFGEIAIDLGIDDSGRVWIIELNAIPGRSVFRRIGAMKIHAQATSRPMEYAYYLSGFAPQSDK